MGEFSVMRYRKLTNLHQTHLRRLLSFRLPNHGPMPCPHVNHAQSINNSALILGKILSDAPRGDAGSGVNGVAERLIEGGLGIRDSAMFIAAAPDEIGDGYGLVSEVCPPCGEDGPQGFPFGIGLFNEALGFHGVNHAQPAKCAANHI